MDVQRRPLRHAAPCTERQPAVKPSFAQPHRAAATAMSGRRPLTPPPLARFTAACLPDHRRCECTHPSPPPLPKHTHSRPCTQPSLPPSPKPTHARGGGAGLRHPPSSNLHHPPVEVDGRRRRRAARQRSRPALGGADLHSGRGCACGVCVCRGGGPRATPPPPRPTPRPLACAPSAAPATPCAVCRHAPRPLLPAQGEGWSGPSPPPPALRCTPAGCCLGGGAGQCCQHPDSKGGALVRAGWRGRRGKRRARRDEAHAACARASCFLSPPPHPPAPTHARGRRERGAGACLQHPQSHVDMHAPHHPAHAPPITPRPPRRPPPHPPRAQQKGTCEACALTN